MNEVVYSVARCLVLLIRRVHGSYTVAPPHTATALSTSPTNAHFKVPNILLVTPKTAVFLICTAVFFASPESGGIGGGWL